MQQERPVFRLVRSSRFSCAQLEEHPAWAEFYEPEERAEIIGWGIDAAWLDRELARLHKGGDHAVYPLLETDPFPPRMLIYCKARFQTPDGKGFSGYLLYANNDYVRAVALCYDGKEFLFNRNLPDRGHETESELRQRLPNPLDNLFPLAYWTDFTDNDGETIAGVFGFIVP